MLDTPDLQIPQHFPNIEVILQKVLFTLVFWNVFEYKWHTKNLFYSGQNKCRLIFLHKKPGGASVFAQSMTSTGRISVVILALSSQWQEGCGWPRHHQICKQEGGLWDATSSCFQQKWFSRICPLNECTYFTNQNYIPHSTDNLFNRACQNRKH